MFQEHHQAIIPKALIIYRQGRSSDSLTSEAFPIRSLCREKSVTQVSKAFYELTAAGTVQDLHLFPY